MCPGSVSSLEKLISKWGGGLMSRIITNRFEDTSMMWKLEAKRTDFMSTSMMSFVAFIGFLLRPLNVNNSAALKFTR